MSEEIKMDVDELFHYGIRGMKWGIRRYQNKDGSLTPAGKRRLAKLDEEREALTGKKSSGDSKSESESSTGSSGSRKLSDVSIEDLRKDTDRNRAESDYINSILNREQSISSYRKAHAPEESNGKKFLSHVADTTVPALKQASGRLLQDFLVKKGEELLGLKSKKSDLDRLREEAETLKAKVSISKSKEYLNEKTGKKQQEEKKSDSDTDRKNDSGTDSKDDRTQNPDEWKDAFSSFFRNYDSVKGYGKATNRNNDDFIDAEWREVDTSSARSQSVTKFLEERRRLRLPSP